MSNPIKTFVCAAIERSGLWRLPGAHAGGAATVFTLHRVHAGARPVVDPSFSISAHFLDAVIGYVIAEGCSVVTLGAMYERLASGEVAAGEAGPPMVVFTFDDGYRDNLTLAAPILARHGVPWTLFLTTGLPDRTCSYWWGALERLILQREHVELDIAGARVAFDTRTLQQKRAAFGQIAGRVRFVGGPELAQQIQQQYGIDDRQLLEVDALSWSEVRGLAERGVEIGAHTVSHQALSRLSLNEARFEMAHCRSRIREMTGIGPDHFAAPFGTPDTLGTREQELARSLGFKTLATTRPANIGSLAHTDMFQLPRITLSGEPERLSKIGLHLSGFMPWVRGARPIPPSPGPGAAAGAAIRQGPA